MRRGDVAKGLISGLITFSIIVYTSIAKVHHPGIIQSISDDLLLLKHRSPPSLVRQPL